MNISGGMSARVSAYRFPGKPRAKIYGLPMIEHVYKRRGMSARVAGRNIAICDKEVVPEAEASGSTAVMTKDTHQRASDQVAEVVGKSEASTGKRIDIVVMIQGDEPMVLGEMLDMALALLIFYKDIYVTNLTARINSIDEPDDFNCTKVVVIR